MQKQVRERLKLRKDEQRKTKLIRPMMKSLMKKLQKRMKLQTKTTKTM